MSVRTHTAEVRPQREGAEGNRHAFDLFKHIDEELFVRLIVVSVIIGTLAVVYVAGAIITIDFLRAIESMKEWALLITLLLGFIMGIVFAGIGVFAVYVYLHHKNS